MLNVREYPLNVNNIVNHFQHAKSHKIKCNPGYRNVTEFRLLSSRGRNWNEFRTHVKLCLLQNYFKYRDVFVQIRVRLLIIQSNNKKENRPNSLQHFCFDSKVCIY